MWKKRRQFCSFAILYLAFCSDSSADTWFAPKKQENSSSSRSHLFVVTPRDNWKVGQCLGSLYRLEGDRRVLVWKRTLINDLSPVRAYASDTGKFVVTTDEWHEMGKLPIVIYGPHGKLIKVHTLKSLGLNPNNFEQTITSLWWNSDAIMFFGPQDNSFVVRFKAGKLLLLDLSTGSVMSDEWFANRGIPNQRKKIIGFSNKRSAEIARTFLNSSKAEERRIGAMVAGELGLVDTIPRLRELLKDETFSTGNDPKRYTLHYYVREAAKNSLVALGERPGDVLIKEFSKTYVAPRSSSRSLTQ